MEESAGHAMTEQEEFEFRARLEAEQAQKPTTRQQVQASMPMRVLQGMRDPIDAGAQLLPRGLEFVTSAGGLAPNRVSQFFGDQAQSVDQGISENEAQYEAARRATGQEGFDAGRFTGNVFSPANAAIAARLPAAVSTAGRVGTGMALGASGGALSPVNTENNPDFAGTKAGQMLIGGVTGGVLTPIAGKVADKFASYIANKRAPSEIVMQKSAQDIAKEMGMDYAAMTARQRTVLMDEIRNAIQANIGKDPAAALRKMDFEAEGMPFLTGQATRDPLQFAAEKNLAQGNKEIASVLQQQGAQLRSKIGQYGMGASPEQQAGPTLINALRNYDAKLGEGVKSAYTTARNSVGKDAEVPMQGLAQDFAEVMDNFGDKIPSGVINQFRKYGVIEGGDMTQRKIFTVEEADKLLKVINANQSNDKATNAALSALRGAVKKSVTEDAGANDVFSGARKLAAEKFRIQDAVPALEAAASGAANPDTFVTNFIVSKTAQTDQVKQLAKILRETDPQAFSEARSQVGAYLQRQALGENLAGDKPVRPEMYAKALREIGEGKLGAFFSPQEIQSMQRQARIAAYVDSVPNASRPNTSGNWQAITNVAQKLPGLPTTLALGGAMKSAVTNQLDASRALSGKLPTNPTPEEIAFISKVLGGGAVATGSTQTQRR
jgi:hypothetical protein